MTVGSGQGAVGGGQGAVGGGQLAGGRGQWAVAGWLLAIGSWLLAGCAKQPEAPVSPAFYHWQTHLQLTENERLYLDSLGVKKLYVKFFDVDWDEASGQPVPHALVEIDTVRLAGLEIVPTVFITNRTFLNLKMEEVPTLAERIFEKILERSQPLQSSNPAVLQSFQFDCDWSGQTREKFFALLNHFKMKMRSSSLIPHSSSLSSTVRLHQFKFFEKTGVPPVDRGMLMFYNMGDLETWETENSILDLETARRYLPNRKSSIVNRQYPIPLDLALPLFRWGVLFRHGRLTKLINGLSEADLQDPLHFTKIAPNRFEVKNSTYLQGHYLYEGDRLRLEGVSQEELEAAAKMLNHQLNAATVAFYHLDTTIVKLFPQDRLENVLDGF